MRKLRLGRELLADLSPDELGQLAGGGPETYNCFISDGRARCLPTRNGCPWTGDPCYFTMTPPSYRICS